MNSATPVMKANPLSMLFAAILFLGIGGGLIWMAGRRTELPPAPAAPLAVKEPSPASTGAKEKLTSFQMTDQEGKAFDSTSLKGTIWVGSVFFSSCPSTCRVQNQRVMELAAKFAERGVRFVSITCDPAHDTPVVLADYARLFHADPRNWHFLTADLDLVQRVGNELMGIEVKGITHSDRLVLFDRQGEILGTYRSTDRDEVLKLSARLEEILTK